MQPVIQEIYERIPVYISAGILRNGSLEFLLSSDDSIMEVAQKSGFMTPTTMPRYSPEKWLQPAEIQEVEYTERYKYIQVIILHRNSILLQVFLQ